MKRDTKPFNITSVCRDDLEAAGFNASRVNDSTMKKLASKLSDDYCDQLFWDSLGVIADQYLNIPRRRVKK